MKVQWIRLPALHWRCPPGGGAFVAEECKPLAPRSNSKADSSDSSHDRAQWLE